MKKKLFFLTVLAAMIFGCAKVPITGRRQLNMLPESTLMAMSVEQYAGFLADNPVVRGGNQAQLITDIGNKMVVAVNEYLKKHAQSKRVEGFQWEFNLVDDPTVNAWCMPGGKVVFYSGILPICRDENGIAVVMGHEIAHAVARHGNERMSQGLAAQLGGMAIGVALSDKPQETQQLFQLAYGIGANVGLILPFSRLHETEADKMGLIFMAMAGYDPNEAPKLWERMSAVGGSRPPEFLSTHPNPEKRQETLKAWIPEAMKHYKAN